MGDARKFQWPKREPVNRRTFRFAGVELKPEDDPRLVSGEALQKQAKRELWRNSIGSLVAGAIPLLGEKWLAHVGLYDLPSPYPLVRHGLLLFYIGWAMYWGVRDCVNATLMDEDRAANRFLEAVINPRMQHLLGAFGIFAVAFAGLIVYNLLGGGIYGFYTLLRQSRTLPTAANAPLG